MKVEWMVCGFIIMHNAKPESQLKGQIHVENGLSIFEVYAFVLILQT